MSSLITTEGLEQLYDEASSRLPSAEVCKTVAILGSGPAAPELARHLSPGTLVVAVNNSWRAAPRYDFLVYADDLPSTSKPPPAELALRGRSSPQYWPAMQAHGGLLYCGATMAMAAGYWVIHNLPYSQVSYFASDMTYAPGRTHFYGQGSPDPLRRDVSLQDLGAKGLRLFFFGLMRRCLLLNASSAPETRLTLPRAPSGRSLRTNVAGSIWPALQASLVAMKPAASAALALEAAAPFDAWATDYSRWMDTEVAWRHTAEVDAAWRELAPLVEQVSAVVEAALDAAGPETAELSAVGGCAARCEALAERDGRLQALGETTERLTAELAQTNQRLAEEVRLGAEQARVNVEQARVNAEQARMSAEQVRLNAEQVRLNAEQVRLNAEQSRTIDGLRMQLEQQAEQLAAADRARADLHADYRVLERSFGVAAARSLKRVPLLFPAYQALKRVARRGRGR